VSAGNAKLLQTQSSELHLSGQGFLDHEASGYRTRLAFSPPLKEGEDYSLRVLSSTDAFVVLASGRAWRDIPGPLYVTAINTKGGGDSGWVKLTGSGGDSSSSGSSSSAAAEGVQVADVWDDNSTSNGGAAVSTALLVLAAVAVVLSVSVAYYLYRKNVRMSAHLRELTAREFEMASVQRMPLSGGSGGGSSSSSGGSSSGGSSSSGVGATVTEKVVAAVSEVLGKATSSIPSSSSASLSSSSPKPSTGGDEEKGLGRNSGGERDVYNVIGNQD
jgi:hypothetical protein